MIRTPNLKGCAVIGAISGACGLAVWNVLSIRQLVGVTYAIARALGGPNSTPQNLSIGLYSGLVRSPANTQHPYLWAGLYGVLVGAVAGGIVGLIVWAMLRKFRRPACGFDVVMAPTDPGPPDGRV